jgi:large subunit ribosomal protein L13
MKTYSTKPSEVRRTWHVLDAENVPLGRLATQAATLIRGKHKPMFAPHLDTGDFVIVVNAAKVAFTGRKLEQKLYYRHSGYPGGLKSRTIREETAVDPRRVVEFAVFGMLPKTSLGKQLHGHLKVYPGPNHPHAAQVNGPAQPSLSQPPQEPKRRRASAGATAARAAAAATRAATTPALLAGPTAPPELAAPDDATPAQLSAAETPQAASATNATARLSDDVSTDAPAAAEAYTAQEEPAEQQGEE